MTMGDYGFPQRQPPQKQPSLGIDAIWTKEYDEFMKKFEEEQPDLFRAVDGWEESPLSPAAIGFPTFLSSNDTTSLPQFPLQQPTTDLSLQRSNSKRPRGDDDAHDHKGKRNRKITDGFPCGEEGCDKRFDRACDLTKHHKRVHTDKKERPHPCPKPGCGLRFCWPKDVKRHLLQVHQISTEDNSLAIRGRPTQGLSLVIKQEPHDSRMDIDGAKPTSATAKSPTMAWLTRSLVMLKKLRLRSKSVDESEDENFIFVTLDKRNFRMVDVHGVNNVDSLNHQIASTFNLQRQNSTSNFLLHRFRKGSKIGEQLAGDSLMAAISKPERAKRTLKLFLTLRNGSYSTQPASFFGGMPTVTSPGSTFS